MFKIISTLFDRCLFAFVFIFALQLPEFIQQYSQRLAGHLNEASLQLDKFKIVADNHFNGNLALMIERFLVNNEASVKETASVIINLTERINLLESQLVNIKSGNIVQRIFYFFTELDTTLIKNTYDSYQISIPLSINALVIGFIFALTFMFILYILLFTCKKCFINNEKKRVTKKVLPTVTNTSASEKVAPKIGNINNM